MSGSDTTGSAGARSWRTVTVNGRKIRIAIVRKRRRGSIDQIHHDQQRGK
jgi:hypothetical protein